LADQKFEIECDESYREIDVRTLLYGIHPDTEPQVIDEIREMKQELKTGQQEIVGTQRVMVENLETTDNPDEIAKPKFRVGENERTEGAALRALYHFLKHVDAH
jgi:hypothetical protein